MCLIFVSDLFLSFIFLNIWCVFGVTYVMTERIILGKAIWIYRVLNSLYCCTIGFNYLFIFTAKNEIWNHGQMLLNMTSRIQMQDFFFLISSDASLTFGWSSLSLITGYQTVLDSPLAVPSSWHHDDVTDCGSIFCACCSAGGIQIVGPSYKQTVSF